MGKKIIWGIMLVGIFMAENAFADWGAWNAWNYRKEVTIDNTANSNSLTDYQVLVTLKPDFNYNHANNDGSDVRFANISGNALSYWIATWTTTGTSSIWVKVTSIPANSSATIYMYYGNPATTTTTANFDNTFTKDFGESGLVGLWHMDEGSGTTVYDSSGNGNTGNMYNFVSPNGWVGTDGGQWDGRSNVNFSVGDHLRFNGSNNYVIVANESNFDFERTDTFSIEAWAKPVVGAGGDIVVKSQSVPGWGYFPGYQLWCGDSIDFNLLHYNDGNEIHVRGGTNLNDGNWHHIVMTYDGSSNANGVSLYADGNSLTKTIIHNNLTGSILNNWRVNIGARQDGTDMFFNGSIDEVRIYNRALSPGEVRAHYERRKYSNPKPIATIGTPTYVNGTITENTTWNVAGSPYIITSNVIVAQGVTLDIKPNVVVKFATDTSLISYGTLTAVGTPDGTITFTSNKPTPQAGDWKGIHLTVSGSNNSIMGYCDIKYLLQYGVRFEYSSAGISTSTISYIAKSNYTAVGIYCFQSSPNILNTRISNINIGGSPFLSPPDYICGIYTVSSSPTITRCMISNISGGGAWVGTLYIAGIYAVSSSLTIVDSEIFNISGGCSGWTSRPYVYGIYYYNDS